MALATVNGREVDVKQDNYRQLAADEIARRRAADPLLTTAFQSAIYDAFKQLAGQPTTGYTYGGGVAVPARNAAAERVQANPMVRGSDAIMSALPHSAARIASDSSNATIGVVGKIGGAVKSGAAAVAVAAREANDTVKIVAVAGLVGALGFLIWKVKA